jgi:ribosome-associated protein
MALKKIEKKVVTKSAPKKVAVKKVAAKKTAVKKTAVKKVAVKETVKTVKEAPKKVVKKPAVIKDPTEKLVDAIIFGMQEKKAENIVTINLKDIKNSVTDYFVICHCESKTQANAIADSVEEQVFKKTGESPIHKEGRENSEWILLDFFNVVVHIFLREQREFFNLEKLWGDAVIKQIKEGK